MVILRTKRRAYTLIELLITSVIFSIVAIYSTATLAGTFRILRISRESQDVGSQSKISLDMITQDIGMATGTPSIRLMTLGDTSFYHTADKFQAADDGLLAISVPQRAADGGLVPNTNEIHVYCPELQHAKVDHTISGRRLARYVITTKTLADSDVHIMKPFNATCLPGNIQTLFGLQNPPTPQYLDDDKVRTLNLRFYPVYADLAGTTFPAFDPNATLGNTNSSAGIVDPFAVKTELSMRYYDSNTSTPDYEARPNAVTTTAPQVVLSALTELGSGYNSPGILSVTGRIQNSAGYKGFFGAFKLQPPPGGNGPTTGNPYVPPVNTSGTTTTATTGSSTTTGSTTTGSAGSTTTGSAGATTTTGAGISTVGSITAGQPQ